jgi:RNA polymerase sigma factor (sigma-70 family)
MPQARMAAEPIPISAVLPILDRILACTCRHLRREDAEDLSSHVRLKLIENDYAILRRFAGRSTWRTYLTVVIKRLVLDYRTHVWGKYRPSAQARRLGAVAMHLERLIQQDGYTADEAISILDTNFRLEVPRAELRRLEALLPVKSSSRRWVPGTELENVACDGQVEERLLAGERTATLDRIQAVLAAALATVPAQDRLILRLRFESGLKVRQIAEALRLPARPLYRRIESCLRHLRHEVEREGLTRESLALVVGCSFGTVQVDLAAGIPHPAAPGDQPLGSGALTAATGAARSAAPASCSGRRPRRSARAARAPRAAR